MLSTSMDSLTGLDSLSGDIDGECSASLLLGLFTGVYGVFWGVSWVCSVRGASGAVIEGEGVGHMWPIDSCALGMLKRTV